MRALVVALVCGSAAALSGTAVRPALRPALSRHAAPAMMSPLDFPNSLLANAGAAEEVGPLLLTQMGVSAAMIVGGFGLETFTEVAEEGIAQPEKKEGETDIFRDSLLRYCGYANEVGEAFRPLVPVAVVYVSYVIAITYILADTVDKGKKGADNGGLLTGGLGAIDTFCWQMLASVLFPSFIINRVVLLLVSLGAEGSLPDLLSVSPPHHTPLPHSAPLFDAHQPSPPRLNRARHPQAGWVPTAAGLILIPLIILPLDVLAHFTMNGSYRRIGNAVLEE